VKPEWRKSTEKLKRESWVVWRSTEGSINKTTHFESNIKGDFPFINTALSTVKLNKAN